MDNYMNNIEELKLIALDYLDIYEASTMNDLNSSDYYPGLYQQKEDLREGCKRKRERIEKLAARPKAHWILSLYQNEEDTCNNNYYYECSNCGAGDVHVKGFRVPYCWGCGAEMENNNE